MYIYYILILNKKTFFLDYFLSFFFYLFSLKFVCLFLTGQSLESRFLFLYEKKFVLEKKKLFILTFFITIVVAIYSKSFKKSEHIEMPM